MILSGLEHPNFTNHGTEKYFILTFAQIKFLQDIFSITIDYVPITSVFFESDFEFVVHTFLNQTWTIVESDPSIIVCWKADPFGDRKS